MAGCTLTPAQLLSVCVMDIYTDVDVGVFILKTVQTDQTSEEKMDVSALRVNLCAERLAEASARDRRRASKDRPV